MTHKNLPAPRGTINPVTWDIRCTAGVPETAITSRDISGQHLSQADLHGCDLRGFIFRLELPRDFPDGNVIEVSAVCRWNKQCNANNQSSAGFQIAAVSDNGKKTLNSLIDEHAKVSDH